MTGRREAGKRSYTSLCWGPTGSPVLFSLEQMTRPWFKKMNFMRKGQRNRNRIAVRRWRWLNIFTRGGGIMHRFLRSSSLLPLGSSEEKTGLSYTLERYQWDLMARNLNSTSLLPDHENWDTGTWVTVGKPGLPGAVRKRQGKETVTGQKDQSQQSLCRALLCLKFNISLLESQFLGIGN